MPSASSVKPEKQASTEAAPSESATSNTTQQNTPIRQAIVIIEHKIRNLDKRKAKLETYRELQRSGKELNQDQKVAVAKYDEVIQTLDFARDLCKQFHGIVTVSEKETKKLARKEAIQRTQQDIAKVREVLLVQDALSQMGAETVREDFLLGRNGASPITGEDLQLLDDLYPTVSPKHLSESAAGAPDFTTQVQQAAEHLLAIVDGKPKEYTGSTYAHVKEVIDAIHNCGYLDRPPTQPEENATGEEWPATEEVPALPEEEFIAAPVNAEMQECVVVDVERIPDQLPPMPNFPPVPEVVQQSAVPVVELPQPYYPPVLQSQPRPINEMLETGSFFFLQESELDSPPEMVVPLAQIPPTAPIPSQTFTNQNFSNVPNPVAAMGTYPGPNLPPPIPMPPSHPVVQAPGNTYVEPAPVNFPPAQEFDVYANATQCDENGTNIRDEHKNGGDWSEQTEDRHVSNQGNRSRGGNRNRPGGNAGYYQNNYYQNNGYGGGYKPRGNRSGGSRGGQGGGNKGSGQYNRSKPPTQQQY